MAEAVVEVKSAWVSKINWTQAVAIACSVGVVAGCAKCDMPAEVQVALVMGIQGIQAVVTWVLKTWFTTTITAASAAPAGP